MVTHSREVCNQTEDRRGLLAPTAWEDRPIKASPKPCQRTTEDIAVTTPANAEPARGGGAGGGEHCALTGLLPHHCYPLVPHLQAQLCQDVPV